MTQIERPLFELSEASNSLLSDSVAKKNSKYELASCLVNIFHDIDKCKDEDFKKKLMENLFLVL